MFRVLTQPRITLIHEFKCKFAQQQHNTKNTHFMSVSLCNIFSKLVCTPKLTAFAACAERFVWKMGGEGIMVMACGAWYGTQDVQWDVETNETTWLVFPSSWFAGYRYAYKVGTIYVSCECVCSVFATTHMLGMSYIGFLLAPSLSLSPHSFSVSFNICVIAL